MDLLTNLWIVVRQFPFLTRHTVVLAAPAVAVLILDRWLRNRA